MAGSSLPADVIANLQRWREHPDAFVREVFQVEPDHWQEEALEKFPHEQRIALKACKGPGKTALEAWISWNFLVTRPEPKIAATSVTKENLADCLWTEMAKWRGKSPLLRDHFTWRKTRIELTMQPEDWWMSARTWSKTADTQTQGETLAGLHAKHMLFVLDEAGGIPEAVMSAAEAGLATGGDTHIVMAGNPTHTEGPLYRACTKDRGLWHVIEITGDPNDPKRSNRIDKKWAQEQIDQYGADNPWVLVNVFGKFPPTSLNALLGRDEVISAIGRGMRPEDYSHAQKRLGIDVARFGDDRTVIFPRQGLMAMRPIEMRNARTNEIASRVAHEKATWGSMMEFVDDTGGYGAGVVDSMLQAALAPIAVNFSSKADDPTRFLNRRAEMWWRMAEWVKRGGGLPVGIYGLEDELCGPTYTFKNGRFQLESKEQVKQRLGFSPDYADALALTFAVDESVGGMESILPGADRRYAGKTLSDYDPFEAEDERDW